MSSAIYEISDGVWQGSHGALMADPDRSDLLRRIDVVLAVGEDGAVVSLPEVRFGFHAAFPDDANGVSDHTWDYFYHFTHNVIARNAVALTLCAMGENRSGLVAAMLLHARTGKNGGEVIDLIRAHVRPRTNQPYALWNPGFVRQVTERLS
jgi:hypothetical protein